MADTVKDWELYERGKRFNQRISPPYYETVDLNWAMFSGDQWRNLKETKLPKPVFNIIKRAITFFIASITSSNTKINFTPLLDTDDQTGTEAQIAKIANEKIADILEKLNFNSKKRDALFDGAITGDYAAHFYFDPSKKPYGTTYPEVEGEICMELVDGVNIMFGNANNANVEEQPYIIVVGRDMVENLREEAKQYKNLPESINSDDNYQYQAGDNSRIELNVEGDEYGKALYIIVYRKDKKTGTIKVSKCVQSAYIYQDIDTGLTRYPVAWGNWEKVKNVYHGRAICTAMIPNQIFINRMFAMVMFHLMQTAFPKAVYNRDYISQWTNEVGQAIPVSGLGLDANIRNIAGYLEPGNMSNQIVQVIEMAMSMTKDTLGISDAALGNIDPKNTSAIIAVQKSSVIPLENPKANLYQWIEDIANIIYDMMGAYYGLRPHVTDVEGQKQVVKFDFSQLKQYGFSVKVDVGEASYWSEIASLQTLDNLLTNSMIDIIDYLERVPDDYIPNKEELINEIKQRQQQQAQNQQPEKQPSIAINFRDLPIDGQIQAAQLAGIQLSQQVMQQQQGQQLQQMYEQAPPQMQQMMQQMAQQGMSDTEIMQALQNR